MRIGISVMTHAGHNIWENGLGQNVFFLARLFRSLSFVESVLFLNCGDQSAMPPQAATESAEFPLVAPRDATDLIDVVIEMGGAMDVEWLDYIRARGKKVVFVACGQPYAGMIEPNVFSRGGYGARPNRCDEVWILPKDEAFAPMLRVVHRCDVFVVPYVWSPMFLERSIAACNANDFVFGFQVPATDEKRPLRAAVFEPNISVVKACSVPMLICDVAYRRDPDSVAELKVFNSQHMVEHTTFNFLAGSLNLVKDNKAVFLAREEFAASMARQADMVVSHQWQNTQNYLYLDTLYGGYPLIHNSPWIADLGYYYPDFDIDAGANQVILAQQTHAANLATYAAKARKFIATLDPEAAANRDRYARRLLRVWSESKSGRAA